MAKQAVFLNYTIMFNPDETGWNSLSDFESSLATFFRMNKMDAEIIRSVTGQSGQRILFLKPSKDLLSKPKVTK